MCCASRSRTAQWVLPFYLKQLTTANVEPIGAEIARPTLDDVFLTLTGRSLRD